MSEVICVAQMVVILNLLIFCILKLSVTKLICEETSVWFPSLSGLVLLRITKPEDMNKVIDTSTSVFKTIMGPSVSEKTELIFKTLMGNTFHLKFGTVLYLHKEIQPDFSEKNFFSRSKCEVHEIHRNRILR